MDAPVGTSTKVAAVGLGKMGFPIAERILDGGFPLAVFNRHAEKAEPLLERGARPLASHADALRETDVCVTVLADDDALESVVLDEDALLSRARPGTVLIDMSTVSVDASQRVARRAADAGVGYLRATMSGNPTVVRSGNLKIFVSGPEEIADNAHPLLNAIGPSVMYVGEGENARVVKLVLQILIGGTAELLGEALVLGEAAGGDRKKLLDVIGASVVGSTFVEYKTEPLLRDDYSATFTTAMMLKDVELVLDLAAESNVELPFARQLRALLESALERGYAEMDFMALYLQLQAERTSTAIEGQVTQ